MRTLLLLSFACFSCAKQEAAKAPAAVGAVSRATTVDNGTNLNGTNLNGTNLNGTNLNGTNLNGTNLNGTNLNGTNLNGPSNTLVAVSLQKVKLQNGAMLLDRTHVAGTMFTGVTGKVRYAGDDFVGSMFYGVTGNNVGVRLQIQAIGEDAAPNDDVYAYSVAYRVNDDGDDSDDASGCCDDAWQTLCVNYDGTPGVAIPVLGYWDYSTGNATSGSKYDSTSIFTFACKGTSAIAKCVEWGYKPWTSVDGVSLADHHQTCTRVVRADFCGDGVSYTQNGTLVDLWDALDVQVDDQPTWSIEAEWDTTGARCMGTNNRGNDTQACYAALVNASTSCGDASHFGEGTLLMSKAAPQ